MSRFMLTAMPFTGHAIQIAAVAAALVERGHDMRVYCGAAFRNQVQSAGARFVRWRHAPDFAEHDLEATFPRLVGQHGLA